MKVALIGTFLNEEETIGQFIFSIADQTHKPDEIILNDGGSTDNSLQILQTAFDEKKLTKLTITRKKGNRSVGRNAAIERSSAEVIACSDIGCILDKQWLKYITEPLSDPTVDVVAGYYKAKAETPFQKCLVPFVLVMPDQLTDAFLPATRSIAFRKDIWKKVGTFPEHYSHNEDYVFAREVQKVGAKIVVAKNAIVYWIPRKSFTEAFIMFFRFAMGDSEAGIVRPKVVALFARYAIACLLLLTAYRDPYMIYFLVILFLLYVVYAIIKNYRYVTIPQAFYLLPALQLTADAAVMTGSLAGLVKKYL
jgi:glycosyltransferase involved in cell wall biosynthesis